MEVVMTEAAAIKFLAIGIDDSENRTINGKKYQKVRVRMEAFIDEEFDKIYFYLTMSRFLYLSHQCMPQKKRLLSL